MSHTLEVDNVILEKGFRRILTGVFLKCETGKVTGLLGRNGCGKSCLMRIIFGEMKSVRRSVRLDGCLLSGEHRNCQDIRFLPQAHFIPGHLTLERIFKDFEVDFKDFVSFFPEFEGYYKQKLKRLSGGERKIVEIYTILTADSKFCMLDEPFAQLMPLHIEMLKKVIRREAAQRGILITDHFYQDVISVSDNIYIINGGKCFGVKDVNDLKKFGYINGDDEIYY